MPQRINFNDDPKAAIAAAAATIDGGGVVIFPTETFYGLGVDPGNETAVERLARIKNRASKPIPIIAATRAEAARVGAVPAILHPLCEMFWPGPLTVAVEPFGWWPVQLVGSGKTIGVRVSSHPAAQALSAAVGGLITSTSANLANKEPVDNPALLDPKLLEQVDLVLDAGILTGGLPSTVVFARNQDVVILRQGAISDKDMQQVLGQAPVML